MSNNNQDVLLQKMLEWKINIFASLPQHIEVIADEFEQLLAHLAPTIVMHCERAHLDRGRGAIQLLETTPNSITINFLSEATIAAKSAEDDMFGQGNEQYSSSIRQLLLHRIKTYNPQTEAVIIWTATDKIGVALWNQYNAATSIGSIVNSNDPEFPF